MKEQNIIPGDWYRILLGETPAIFLVEILLRTIIMYTILLLAPACFFSRRTTGRSPDSTKRSSKIGSYVPTAAWYLKYPTASSIVLNAVLYNGGPLTLPVQTNLHPPLNEKGRYSFRRLAARIYGRRTGRVLLGLVADSVLDLQKMKSTGITKEKEFSQLRSNGIRHLGEVKRLYFEAGGSFTLIRNSTIRPGLGILPEADIDFIRQVCRPTNASVCKRCGRTPEKNTPKCENCCSDEWITAVE